VLLLLHGGPGDVQSPFVDAYAPYERDFTLVQWDQRGSGQTYGRQGGDTPELTLDRLVADGIDLAEQLEARFDAPIVILGHSWGSVIGVEMAQRRPDLFAAYVGTGQVGGWDAGVRAQYDFVRARAESSDDAATLAALDALDPFDPKSVEHFVAVNRPMRAALGSADRAWIDTVVQLTEDNTTQAEFDAIGGGMELSGRTLFPTQLEEDLFATAGRFEIPVFVIQGREDLFTPTAVAAAYFDHIQAPEKELVVIEGAGHFALVTHTEQFLAALKRLTDGVLERE
jgi:pimeloyl-ACP methyl ester carboxylesterase